MLSLDEILAIEIYAEKQKIEYDASDRFKELLIYIVGALKAGDSIKSIKRYIHRYVFDKDIADRLKLMIDQQGEHITGSAVDIKLTAESVAGFTFLENIANRDDFIRRRAVSFAAQARNLLSEGKGVRDLIRNEVKKYVKGTEAFYRNETKAGREHAYTTVDNRNRAGIKGWISIAVLDNKTSPICVGLHNRFYSREKYRSRSNVPNRPPRHPHCRSILITVYDDKKLVYYKGQNLESFLHRNPAIGRDIMGIEKYRLFSEKKIKAVNFIDLKGQRFYTNEQIRKRLHIKK